MSESRVSAGRANRREVLGSLGALPLCSMPEVYRRADVYLGLPLELEQQRGNLIFAQTETMGRSKMWMRSTWDTMQPPGW